MNLSRRSHCTHCDSLDTGVIALDNHTRLGYKHRFVRRKDPKGVWYDAFRMTHSRAYSFLGKFAGRALHFLMAAAIGLLHLLRHGDLALVAIWLRQCQYLQNSVPRDLYPSCHILP